MSLKDFVFELENLKTDVRILTAIFDMCFEGLDSAVEGDDTGLVILGLFNYTYDISQKMNKLVDKGFSAIQQNKE